MKERLVKDQVRSMLDKLVNVGHPIFYWMPVQSGYGRAVLDFEGCYRGQFFAIETKSPGKWLTVQQRHTALEMCNAGGTVFIISSGDGLMALARWIAQTSLHLGVR